MFRLELCDMMIYITWWYKKSCRFFSCVTNQTLWGDIFCHLEAGNLPEGNKNKHGGQWTQHRTEKDSDQPRQNEELVPKRRATSVTWTWFRYEKSDTDQKHVTCWIENVFFLLLFVNKRRKIIKYDWVTFISQVYNLKCN